MQAPRTSGNKYTNLFGGAYIEVTVEPEGQDVIDRGRRRLISLGGVHHPDL